jgi:hypothetical protein
MKLKQQFLCVLHSTIGHSRESGNPVSITGESRKEGGTRAFPGDPARNIYPVLSAGWPEDGDLYGVLKDVLGLGGNG